MLFMACFNRTSAVQNCPSAQECLPLSIANVSFRAYYLRQ